MVKRGGTSSRISSMSGPFTRSRSEVFLHRTRSGRSRLARTPLAENLIAVRDLRSKRVFSGETAEIDSSSELKKFGTEEKGNGGGLDESKGSEGSDEDLVQSTPPNGVSVCEFDGGSDGIDRRPKIAVPESNNLLRNRMGLVPCYRSKLYRNPSSFSYRRLLPYLMDLAKDESDGMEILQSKNYSPKVEKTIEEKPPSLNAFPLSKQQHHTVTLGDSSMVNSVENADFEQSPVLEGSVSDSHEECLHNPIKEESPKSSSESILQVPETNSEIPIKSSNFEFEMLQISSYSPPTTREALSVQELAGDVRTLSCSLRKTEMGSGIAGSAMEMERKCRTSHGVNQALAPRKSILKRRVSGCRGICTCLDCASFHLHAERAYEFSRKQMLEADEVVAGLMKELSQVRNLLERSVAPIVEGAGRHTVLQLNQEQLTAVCRRAFRAEEIAKSRTTQMIRDLNMHCRIPGQSVTFSECVEERIIP